MNQLKSTVSLQLSEAYSKRLSGEIGSHSSRSSSSLPSARLTQRYSAPGRSRLSKPAQRVIDLNEQVKQNQLNFMFLKRKHTLKEISLANQNIYLRIQSQKSQYKLRNPAPYQKGPPKLTNVGSRLSQSQNNNDPLTARSKLTSSRKPLASLAQYINLFEIDRQLKNREQQIRDILKSD